jgi:hypothetical protein
VLGVGPEVVEGPKRSINAPFIEVCGFSRAQSHILHIVCVEAYVGLRTMHALPLVTLRILIFDPNYIVFCLFWLN